MKKVKKLYVTAVFEDGSQLQVTGREALINKDEGSLEITLPFPCKMEEIPAVKLPTEIFDLDVRHEGMRVSLKGGHTTLSGTLEHVTPIESSDERGNWDVYATRLTVGGVEYYFTENWSVGVER